MRTHLLLSTVTLLAATTVASAAANTTCRLKYSLSGWSAVYEKANGRGRVTCDNGQSANVNIALTGAGAIAGKTKIDDGTGRFSAVQNIDEVFGDYAAAEAAGGAVKAGEAQVLTKGPVSLALAGKGRGWALGVAGAKFSISKAAPSTKTRTTDKSS